MLALLLMFGLIPPAPTLVYNNESYVEIKAPPEFCYDVIIAFANVVDPGWRANPFPVWATLAKDAKDTGRISYSWGYYGEELPSYEREVLLGLTYFGYKYRYKKGEFLK